MKAFSDKQIPFAPKAVLFDLDGTLVESEREVASALDQVLSLHGRPLTDEERAFVIGHAWGDIYARLSQAGPLPFSRPAMELAVLRQREEHVATHGFSVLKGAREAVLDAARRAKVGLVTGSSSEEARWVLSGLSLLSVFQTLCCAEDYERGKPCPDPFVLGAKRLGVSPADCIAVEDSNAGIRAAKAAGIFCVAVAAGNFAGQDQSEADLILPDLTFLPPAFP